ncbi:MAG TPA: hypothetical protein VMR25_08430 [Planctomycetaceae bacterium]|nr:hypothetical protein [Planctomycetaceae bacterium]
MTVSLPRKPGRKPLDKLAQPRRYRWTPGTLCPQCGAPMYAYSSALTVRYLKCRECGATGKETR